MDISSFTATNAARADTVPMPAQSAPPPMRVIDAQEPPHLAAPAEPVTEAAPSAADATQTPAPADAAPTAPDAPAAEQTPPPTDKPAKVDPRFSALAKKEAQLFREREALKAEKAAIEAAHRQVVTFEEAKQAAKLNPVAALEALGLTPAEVNEYILNGGKVSEVTAVREEIERFKAEQEAARVAAEKAAAERLDAERNAVLDSFRRDAVAFVEASTDRYTLTRINNAATLVPQVVEQHFAKTGELLTTAQAADLVEKHFESIADRVVQARQGQARPEAKKAAPTPSPAPAPVANAPTQPAASKTLSNALTASASATTTRPRTDKERIQAALARLSGN